MGDLIHVDFPTAFEAPDPADEHEWTIRDALGNETYAESMEAAVLAGFQLQQDHYAAQGLQGSGQQAISFYQRGELRLTIDRVIGWDEAHRAKEARDAE